MGGGGERVCSTGTQPSQTGDEGSGKIPIRGGKLELCSLVEIDFFTTRASRAAIQSWMDVCFVGSGPILKIAVLEVWVVKEIDHHQ